MEFKAFSFAKKILCLGFVLGAILAGAFMSEAGDSLSEEESLLAAARQYFDAEVRKDYPLVYACLSPSSAYCYSHSYEEYLEEALSSPNSVGSYRIIDITYIRDNDDRDRFPQVEKFAEIEVEVVLLYADTGKTSEFNIGFVFLKEGGKWYKS